MERIESVLTSEQWSAMKALNPAARSPWVTDAIDNGNWPVAIALLNERLAPNDPRKITREWVRLLRAAAAACSHEDHWFAHELGEHDWTEGRESRIAAQYDALADALESYLPPEGA